MKTNSWTTAGQAKDISSSPTHWLKFYEEAVIESEARTLFPRRGSQISKHQGALNLYV